MKAKAPDLEEQIRKAIQDSGMTVYRIAKDAEVSQPALCRFVNGHRGITLKTASKLVNVLGLKLVKR